MRISIKHFLLGALVASVPMTIYVYLSLMPLVTTESKAITQTQFLATEKIINSQTLITAEFTTPTPTTIPTTPIPKPTIKPQALSAKLEVNAVHKTTAPNDVQVLIEKYADMYKVNKDMMVHVARCESGFRANAVNGPYAGIYQFLASTWKSNRAAMGQDTNPELRFNADEAIKTAAFKMSRDGFSAWPDCSRKATALLTAK